MSHCQRRSRMGCYSTFSFTLTLFSKSLLSEFFFFMGIFYKAAYWGFRHWDFYHREGLDFVKFLTCRHFFSSVVLRKSSLSSWIFPVCFGFTTVNWRPLDAVIPFWKDYSMFRGGSGGGTSGRAMAFCLSRPGSNPMTDFKNFQFRIADNLFSLSVGIFQIMCNRTVHTIPFSFLFPIIIYNCQIYQTSFDKFDNVLRKS